MRDFNQLNILSGEIIGAAIEVHRQMGPGLAEEIYELCLMKELEIRGIKAQKQVRIALTYKEFPLNKEYIIDILVNDLIIIELKAVEMLLPIHEAQIINYLKLTKKPLGLLINFNVPVLKNGIRRFAN